MVVSTVVEDLCFTEVCIIIVGNIHSITYSKKHKMFILLCYYKLM